MLQLVLVRHCRTDWNDKGLVQGWADIPLNDAGRKEAFELAQKLKPLWVSIIYSSDLKRAAQTARIISREVHARVLLSRRLRECSVGRLSGMTGEDVDRKVGSPSDWPTLIRTYDYRLFGGEHREKVLARQRAFLDRIYPTSSSLKILIVGHGTALNTLLDAFDRPVYFRRGEYREIDYYPNLPDGPSSATGV